MQAIFRLNERTLAQLVRWGIAVLHDTIVPEELVWPTDSEWTELKTKYHSRIHTEFSDVVAILDGTTVHVSTPKDPTESKSHYMYKKRHAINFQVICDLGGRIVFLSKHAKGAHDQRDFNNSGIRERFVGKPYGLMADAIYTFNRKNDIRGLIKGYAPLKKSKNQPLTILQKAFNVRLRISRALVENVNGRLKSWRVLGNKCLCYNTTDHARFDIDEVARVVCALTNILIRDSPLRQADWDVRHGWDQ